MFNQFKILSALNACVFLTLRAIYGPELFTGYSYYCSFTDVSPYIRSINVRIKPLLCNPTYNHVSVSLQLLPFPSLVFNSFMTTLAYKITMCRTTYYVAGMHVSFRNIYVTQYLTIHSSPKFNSVLMYHLTF